MRKLVIVGTGVIAIRVYEFVKQYNLYEIVCFVVDKKYKTKDKFYDLNVYSFEELEEKYKKDEIELFIAIHWNNLNRDRKEMFYRLKEKKYKLANLVSPNSIVRGKILGENCWIQDYVIFDVGATIGDGTFLAGQSYVSHDTKIGKFVHIGAKSMIGGGSNIEDQVFIGLCSVVFDEVIIKRKCIIGGGTVIKRNIPENTVCKLETNNLILKNYPEDIIESKLVAKKNVR